VYHAPPWVPDPTDSDGTRPVGQPPRLGRSDATVIGAHGDGVALGTGPPLTGAAASDRRRSWLAAPFRASPSSRRGPGRTGANRSRRPATEAH